MLEREKLFLAKVEKLLQKIKVEKTAHICIGVSGGPDSTSLLFALTALKDLYSFRLFSVYIDHGLRSVAEIDEEITFLKKCSTEIDAQFLIKRIPHGELENDHG